MAYLSDDGTMDTVIVCDKCGRETRFNFSIETDMEATEADAENAYDAFIDECIADVDEDCAHCDDADNN